jgi:deazaflavin-dependent oxidoreductase (nitroreductase family)
MNPVTAAQPLDHDSSLVTCQVAMDHQSLWVVRTVRPVLVRVVAGFFLLVAAMGIVFVVGIRRKSAAVVNAVRRLSRATKALPLKTAGTGDGYASVVRHVGRTSGKSYETPVHAVATDGGFAIALPYGSGSDWVKNVLAGGTAAIVYGGRMYPVDEPKIVPLAAATPSFTSRDRLAHRLFGVKECLIVRDAEKR